VAGCATRVPTPNDGRIDNIAMPGDPTCPSGGSCNTIDYAKAKFAQALKTNLDTPTSDNAQAAFNAGRLYLDLGCESYLTQLGIALQSESNDRAQVNLVSGLTSSILGLAKAGSGVVAGVAAGFSFTGSSLDSSATHY